MAEFTVTRLDRSKLDAVIEDMLKTVPVLKVTVTDTSIGKWGMSRLWRSWMDSTASWMASKGARMPLSGTINGKPTFDVYRADTITEWRPYNKNDAHESFTYKWLGTNENGERLSWQKSEGENTADKGQRYHAMVNHQVWMLERGIRFMDPRDSEFRQLCAQMGLD